MSNELNGAVAFEKRSASSKGMRAALRAALTDGILDGCALTYGGGLSCSVAAGFLMIGGGVAHNPSSMTLGLSRSSGYARIIANVDLSKAATESDFKQCFFTVDYSATVGGFGALTQSDINMSGQVYQFAFAIINIGVGIESSPVFAESASGARRVKHLWSGNSYSSALVVQRDGGSPGCTGDGNVGDYVKIAMKSSDGVIMELTRSSTESSYFVGGGLWSYTDYSGRGAEIYRVPISGNTLNVNNFIRSVQFLSEGNTTTTIQGITDVWGIY